MSSDFIKMISDFNERRLSRTIQSLVENKTPCAIFFAPGVPENARQIADSFKAGGINLNCICVLTDEQKQVIQPVEDENIVAAEEFPSLPVKPKFIFTLGGFFPLMFGDYFKACGTEMITSADISGAEDLYNLYMKHMPELYAVHEMLADDESKKVFRASIIGKETNLLSDFRFASEPQYFLSGFLPTQGDIAIDGGSYDGGTSADFARQGAQVYAFEMDAANYKNCIEPAEKFGFTIENLGLSNQESDGVYASWGAGSRKLANAVGGVYRGTSSTWTLTSREKIFRASITSSLTSKARNLTCFTARQRQ